MPNRIIALFLLLAAQEAQADCTRGVYRAGCTTPNGAVMAGPNGAAAVNQNGMHTTQQYDYYHAPNTIAPGTNATGWRGNSATKAVQQGCAFVNGKRVCN
jgi:hypothetical protein